MYALPVLPLDALLVLRMVLVPCAHQDYMFLRQQLIAWQNKHVIIANLDAPLVLHQVTFAFHVLLDIYYRYQNILLIEEWRMQPL